MSNHYLDVDSSAILGRAEVPELQNLITKCNNELSVKAPTDMPFSDSPVLTPDRQGSLGAIVGSEAYGLPAGRSILAFMPLTGKGTAKSRSSHSSECIFSHVAVQTARRSRTQHGTNAYYKAPGQRLKSRCNSDAIFSCSIRWRTKNCSNLYHCPVWEWSRTRYMLQVPTPQALEI